MRVLLPLHERLRRFAKVEALDEPILAQGYLTRVVGLTLEAVGINASVGHNCKVIADDGTELEAEVVGFHNEVTYLMPVQKIQQLQAGARVIPLERSSSIVMGDHLYGRVINGIGQPLDDHGEFPQTASAAYRSRPINPLHRHPIQQTLDVGIRAINSLLTIGKGQRIGLFAGSGVGKSVLLGMMTRYTLADVVVVGLIGERGREVKEFIDQILGKEGLKKAVVIAAPADEAPLMRLRAAQLATQVAEYFRDRGKNVLLLMDSLTRFAQAQREIALAIGEPPATKGYPPSVFAKLPELVERAGNGEKGGGSITAFYTVLTEGDDLQDPIADSARAILDGHIVLSRDLADQGIYPAIDVEASVSRVMQSIVAPDHLQAMLRFKKLLSSYHNNRDLITIGAYSKGSDPAIDEAIVKYPKLLEFLSQRIEESARFDASLNQLRQLVKVEQKKPAGNNT